MTPSPAATSDPRLSLFSVLWACATLFHLAANGWTMSPMATLLAAASLLVLLRPSSAFPLAGLAIIQIIEVYRRTPHISNHWFFTALVNVTVLLAFIQLVVRRRRFAIDPAELFDSFAPAVRVEVLIFYFFAVFHKLNTAFLDPTISCATVFYTRQADLLGFLPRGYGAQAASIAFTLLTELAILIMLWTRRARRAGILVAIVFHGLIAINPISGFYNFSSMIAAVVTLFLSRDMAAHFVARWKSTIRGMPWLGWFVCIAFVVELVVIWRLVLVHDVFVLVWIAYAGVLVGALLPQAFRSDPADTMRPFRLRTVQWCMPVLVFLNGSSPYLGLKTENTFAMFSNLRTEGRITNHLLVPAGWQPFDLQEDIVEVRQSSDQLLRSVARRNLLIPYFELRRRPRASIAYRQAGREVRFDRVEDDPKYPGPIHPVLDKLIKFRPIEPGLRQTCRH
jgi:hypothetical protein